MSNHSFKKTNTFCVLLGQPKKTTFLRIRRKASCWLDLWTSLIPCSFLLTQSCSCLAHLVKCKYLTAHTKKVNSKHCCVTHLPESKLQDSATSWTCVPDLSCGHSALWYVLLSINRFGCSPIWALQLDVLSEQQHIFQHLTVPVISVTSYSAALPTDAWDDNSDKRLGCDY